ncbi:MAG TPA: hypothetical protein VN240_02135 [Propylenella sp.]|nr:hypothetical protein [Propylenella sp.]
MQRETHLLRKARVFEGLGAFGKETGLALLKPGVSQAVVDTFVALCEGAGLTIVADGGRFHLTLDDMGSLFLNQDRDYCAYMTSGGVRPFLVEGENAVQRLTWVKAVLRLQHGAHLADIENIVHTADEGIEIERQTKFFFFGHAVTAHADLAITWQPDLLDIAGAMAKRNLRVHWLGLVIEHDDLTAFIDSLDHLEFGEHFCIFGIRFRDNDLSRVLFPSPFEWEIFFKRAPADILQTAILSRGGLCAVEPDRSALTFPSHDRSDFRPEPGASVPLLIRQLDLFDRSRLMAIRTLHPADGFFEAEVVRKCAATLHLQPWGGSDSPAATNWRPMGRGSFERFIYAMPDL